MLRALTSRPRVHDRKTAGRLTLQCYLGCYKKGSSATSVWTLALLFSAARTVSRYPPRQLQYRRTAVAAGRGTRRCLHWRNSASISAGANRRPARILPWQANRAIAASSRSSSAVASSSSANSSARSRNRGAGSGAPSAAGNARTRTAPRTERSRFPARAARARPHAPADGARRPAATRRPRAAAAVVRAHRPPASRRAAPRGSVVHARRADRPVPTRHRQATAMTYVSSTCATGAPSGWSGGSAAGRMRAAGEAATGS